MEENFDFSLLFSRKTAEKKFFSVVFQKNSGKKTQFFFCLSHLHHRRYVIHQEKRNSTLFHSTLICLTGKVVLYDGAGEFFSSYFSGKQQKKNSAVFGKRWKNNLIIFSVLGEKCNRYFFLSFSGKTGIFLKNSAVHTCTIVVLT